MKIKAGKGPTKFGKGIDIILSGDEVATAIKSYLVAHGIHAFGPQTITVNRQLCQAGRIYVDPSGFVIARGVKVDGQTGRVK